MAGFARDWRELSRDCLAAHVAADKTADTNPKTRLPWMAVAVAWQRLARLAPEVGLEPTTPRLTAACSTIELLWNPYRLIPTRPDPAIEPLSNPNGPPIYKSLSARSIDVLPSAIRSNHRTHLDTDTGTLTPDQASMIPAGGPRPWCFEPASACRPCQRTAPHHPRVALGGGCRRAPGCWHRGQ